jgi:hypothetical protein
MNPVELFRQETASLQLSLDEIVARAIRELWTCGDSDTVQRANTAIIRGACLAAVESVFTAWEEGGDLAASKMREEICGLKTQLESYQKGRQSPCKTAVVRDSQHKCSAGRTDERNARRSSTGKFVAGPKVRGGNPAKNDTQQRKK